jgi:hypothetical protein
VGLYLFLAVVLQEPVTLALAWCETCLQGMDSSEAKGRSNVTEIGLEQNHQRSVSVGSTEI